MPPKPRRTAATSTVPPARTEPKRPRARGTVQAPQATRSDGATDVKRRADGTPGNNKADRAWIQAHAAELRPVDDPSMVPFGVRTQWEGSANDENYGSEFWLPDQANRCTGTAYVRDADGRHMIDKDGLVLLRPCFAWRLKGMTVCGTHGGLTDQGLAAARKRLIAAADPAVGHLIAIAFNKSAAEADRIRALNSILDRAGLRSGVEISVETPGWQSMLKEMFESVQDN